MLLPENQIVQGDCRQILKSISSQSVDLVLTDPPYLVNYRDRSGRTRLPTTPGILPSCPRFRTFTAS